jgi:hypothetical protein
MTVTILQQTDRITRPPETQATDDMSGFILLLLLVLSIVTCAQLNCWIEGRREAYYESQRQRKET